MKKLILILLAIILLVPFVASCKEDTDVSKDAGSTSGTNDVALVAKDMEGRDFNILCYEFGHGSKSIVGFTGEVLYDEESSSPLDVKKEEVVNRVQQEYNCTVTGDLFSGTHAELNDKIRNMVMGGTNEYDFYFDCYQYSSAMVADNSLYDLNTISTIDFTNPWWDQNAREDFTIDNKLYFMCGDINTYDNDGTWCVLFNKNLKSTLGIEEDFYQLAKDYEWTFDKFTEICKRNITQDTNGDNLIDEKDQWAFGTETYNMYVHVVAGGDRITKKDSNDIPYFTIQNESTYNSLEKIRDFYLDGETVMVANAPPYSTKGFENMWEATVHKSFIEGRELFYMCGLINVPGFREMDDDFGILPVPLMNEGQDSYYHTVSVSNMSALSIPSNVIGVEDVGIIIEALGKYSMDILTPEYYEVQLKTRNARDNESSEMLDMIFASRSFDIGAAFNWGQTLSVYMEMDKNYVSKFESIMTAAQAQMDDTINEIQN